jgi:Tfp pilus assembly protein PilW
MGSSSSTPRILSLFRMRRRCGAAGPGRPRRAGNPRRPRAAVRRQLGMSLIEVIVAATLALIGFLVALVLYSAARNLFKKGEQATDQQQEVRAGYDMMVKDLRLAGYNWNASGEDRPGEEQIEGAWDGAVTIRGDFDFEDATKSTDPESVIAGSTNKATVGNDEIVTYCLRRATGTDATTTTFNADVTSATTAASGGVTVATRDGVTEAINISGIATGTAQDNPPYNLYRVTLNNDNSTYGSANFQTWTLLAQNIKSLQFVYRDANGVAIPASSLGGSEANKGNRETIKKIDVTIVGMTAVADNKYTDPDPLNASTSHFRKFSLTTEITPRNLGFKGRADVDTTPPSIPTGLAVCPGHCGAMVAKWNANPANEGVSLYTVKYGTSVSTMNSLVSTSGTNVYISGLTEDQQYYFSVRATDSGGNSSSYTSTANAAVGDLGPTVTTPSTPSGFAATGGAGALNGMVNLSWTAVTTNTTPLACDPLPIIRDLAGYRLYRSTASTFTPNDVVGNNMVQSEADGTLTATAVAFSDKNVVNCRPYYYSLKAVDTSTCLNKSAAMATPVGGQSTSSTAPAAPVLTSTFRTGTTSATVVWASTTADVNSAPITIDKYNLWRCQINNLADPEAATYTAVSGSPTTCTGTSCTFVDTNAPADLGNKRVYYKVSALDDCPNESARSSAQEATCAFNGVVSIVPQSSPPSLTSALAQTVTVSAVGGDVYTSATLTIIDSTGATVFTSSQVATGNNWNFVWTPSTGGTYTATATVTNSSSCVGTASNIWTVVLAACSTCATIPANNPDSTTTVKYYRIQNFINNSCSFPLQITRVTVRESNPTSCSHNSCNTLKLQKIQYLQTGTFADETSNVVWTSTVSGGSTVAPATSVVVDFSPALDLTSNSSGQAKMRFIFDQTTPIWITTQNNRQHTIIGDFNFTQVSSLCAPATVTSQLD